MIAHRRLLVNNRPVVFECIELAPSNVTKSLPTIVVVPGNPAILPYYETFLHSMHQKLDKRHRILAVNHLGHHSDNTHKENGSNHEFFGLTDQVQHKIAFVDSLLEANPEEEFIFMGHSIGAYMVMRMLMERPDIKAKKVYHLFPTLHSLKVAPFIEVVTYPWIRDVLIPVVANAPQVVKDFFVWMSGSSHDEAALSNVSSYFHSSCLRNILHLVRDELIALKDLRAEEKEHLIEHADKSHYLFTKYDPYVSLDMVEDYRKILPEQHEKVYKFDDSLKIKHAFVLSNVQIVVYYLVDHIIKSHSN
jgi:pimeloyl-ACP methyl ester carboxylesterase